MSKNLYSQDLFRDRFVNDPLTAIDDSLVGYLNGDPNVGLLDCGNVVIRRDYASNDIVKIVSGGASGHEPAHSGFVGRGMLSAAIQGDVFSSPTVSDILHVIKEISYQLLAGVLVIVQNGLSERLNFGLAVERARSQGIDAKLLLVTEECCVVNEKLGRRGLSGVVLLNKVAGAMAEAELHINDIFDVCTRVHQNMTSVLLCLRPIDSCVCAKRWDGQQIEIGTGLHGEIGARTIEKMTVERASHEVIKELSGRLFMNTSVPVVVLINNLGGCLMVEEQIFVKEIVDYLRKTGLLISRLYHGSYFTSLDMRGFSVTLLNVYDNKILEYLDQSCEARAWGHVSNAPVPFDLDTRIVSRVSKRKRKVYSGPCISNDNADIFRVALRFVCDALISCEKQINVIDSNFSGGNVGSKIKRGAQTILTAMDGDVIDFTCPRGAFESLGDIAEKTIGGPIGFFYGISLEAAANSIGSVPENQIVDVRVWLDCLRDAAETLKRCGNTEFGLGTMYDPLWACIEAFRESLKDESDGLAAFGVGVRAAEEAIDRSKEPGRKYPDPGAHVVGIWMRALYECFKIYCTNDCSVSIK